MRDGQEFSRCSRPPPAEEVTALLRRPHGKAGPGSFHGYAGLNHGPEVPPRLCPDRCRNLPDLGRPPGTLGAETDGGGTAMESAAQVDDTVVLDRQHLARMTLGNRSLEHEVLELFDRQAELLLGRMRKSDSDGVYAMAHALKGSAAGIGAAEVARAAELTERATKGSAEECSAAIDRLAGAVDKARAVITELLRQR
ncbi:Hpt domain-containing protein [Undibacter mobilis]|uniref:Hpt domain-containing protein n=2 Tax=Undibacter mobilis TaxID=2292256 RepID=A0A371BC17_9BRAD|nr:Hpt domain-containing protein [Undibacter mobilis]